MRRAIFGLLLLSLCGAVAAEDVSKVNSPAHPAARLAPPEAEAGKQPAPKVPPASELFGSGLRLRLSPLAR